MLDQVDAIVRTLSGCNAAETSNRVLRPKIESKQDNPLRMIKNTESKNILQAIETPTGIAIY